MTRRILCLGMSAHDSIYQLPAIPATPTKVLATGFAECGGGMAANASVAVARLSGAASYWGRVGDDALGARICAELADEGVDVSRVRRVPHCVSPSAAILVAADGERLVCAYNDPNLDRDASWLPLAEVADFDAVLADVRWPEGATRVLEAARDAGTPAVLDGDIGPAEVLRDLATRVTHAIFSEVGLAQATGEHDAVAGLHAMAAHTRAIVGVTLGAQGTQWIEHGQLHAAAAPQVQAVDTLGAGDVFHGAFTLALAEGATTAGAMHFANAAAAIKCARFGGRRGAPSRTEVDALLRAGSAP
jgi:sulfofructose kinase